MINRLALSDLLKWFKGNNRKPLILRGARQVGKSTLVQTFANKMGLDLIEVNLELDTSLASSFLQMNPELILRDILSITRKTLKEKSILFIDEIQKSPEAIQALRYFYEKYETLPVIAAGSLLDFALTESNFSMPVGRVEFYYLGPLRFSEFLEALSENQLLDYLNTWNWNEEGYSNAIHERLLERYYEFLITGGLPEAVWVYANSSDFEAVRKVHRSIILTYKSDFSKYRNKVPTERIERVFDYTAVHVGQKVKYSQMSQNEQAAQIRQVIGLLHKAQLLLPIVHTNASGLPLKSGENEKVYKLLFLDIGIMSYMMNLDYTTCKKLFTVKGDDLILLHKGMLAEQFVGQHLSYVNPLEPPHLNYWLRDGAKNKAEVDFLIQKGLHRIPIEVKGGKSNAVKSLIQFAKEKNIDFAIKFSINPPKIIDKKIQELNLKVYQLPIYFAERLTDLIDE